MWIAVTISDLCGILRHSSTYLGWVSPGTSQLGRQVFPCADKGSGDQWIRYSGDGVPTIWRGIVTVQSFTPLRPKITSNHIKLISRGHGMAAHPFGRHVAHSSPLTGFTVKAISRGSCEFCVAAHDKDLASQDSSCRVAPGLRALGRDVPAVSYGVVTLDLQNSKQGIIQLQCYRRQHNTHTKCSIVLLHLYYTITETKNNNWSFKEKYNQ